MNMTVKGRHGWIFAMLVAMACGPDAGGGGSTEGSSSGGASSSGGSAGMTNDPTMASVGTSNNDGSTTSNADTTGTPGDTTAMGSSSGDASTGGSSSGEPPGVSYPPCEPMDPPCPEPYDLCIAPGGGGGGVPVGNWCSLGCMDAGDCPAPTSGTAEPACGGPPGQDTVCQLDCSDGDCPDGMECVALGPMAQVQLCVWPI